MVNNLSEITDVISNVTVSFQNVTTENIVPIAIQNSNDNTGGWIGIFIFAIFFTAVSIYVWRYKNNFEIFSDFSYILTCLSIGLDIGIQLLLFGILASLKTFIWVYIVFFVVGVASFLKKELNSVDT